MGGSSNSIYDVAAEKAELEVYKKDSSQASPMKPWEWPIAYYLLIPIIVVFICWFVLLFEHFTKVQNIRFQALYMRIVLVLPLIMSLEYVAACFPWIVPWIEFFIAFIEGYVLYAFLALIVGIGWRHNDAYEVLSNSRFTRGPFSRFRIEWGKFSSGEVALRYWKRIVFQFAIVRPIVNVVIPIITLQKGEFFAQKQQITLLLRLIGFASLLAAIVAIIFVYRAFNEKKNEFASYEVFHKFLVVKLLFTFIAVNNIIIKPLIESRKIGIAPWVCTNELLHRTALTEYLCEERLAQLVFMFEIMLIVIPTTIYFRHKDFTTGVSTNGISISASCRVFARVFYIFDLGFFFSQGPKDELHEPTKIASDSSLQPAKGEPQS